MTVNEIVANYLKQNGFNGLFCDSCGCSIEDAPMCECFGADCAPGYEHKNKDTCPPDCKMNCFERRDMGGSWFCATPVYTEAPK
jgi:hypothetical protein